MNATIEKLVNDNNFEMIKNSNFKNYEIWIGIELAACNGKSDILKELVEKLDSLAVLPENSCKAVSLATFNGHVECVSILLEKGASYDSYTQGSSLTRIKSQEMYDLYAKFITSEDDIALMKESLRFFNETAN